MRCCFDARGGFRRFAQCESTQSNKTCRRKDGLHSFICRINTYEWKVYKSRRNAFLKKHHLAGTPSSWRRFETLNIWWRENSSNGKRFVKIAFKNWQKDQSLSQCKALLEDQLLTCNNIRPWQVMREFWFKVYHLNANNRSCAVSCNKSCSESCDPSSSVKEALLWGP